MSNYFSTGLEDAKEAADILTEAQTELDQVHAYVQEDVEAVDNVQARILKLGASRADIEELEQVTASAESYLHHQGIAIESFTSFPSRTNKQIALEMADDVKNKLIGGAIVAGVAIVAKIIHMIWKWFKNKDTRSERQKSEEERLDKTLAQMRDFYDLPAETRDRLLERAAKEAGYEDALEWQKNIAPTERYTELLHRVFSDQNSARDIMSAFSQMSLYGSALVAFKSTLQNLPGAEADTQTKEVFTNWYEGQFNRVLEKEGVKAVLEFKEKFGDLLENVREYAKTSHPMDKTTILDFYRIVNGKVFQETMKKITEESKINEHAGQLEDYDKISKNVEARLKEWAEINPEKATMSPEDKKDINEKLNKFKDLYNDAARAYLSMLTMYNLVQQQYIVFISTFSAEWVTATGFFKKLLKQGKIEDEAAKALMARFNISKDEMSATKK